MVDRKSLESIINRLNLIIPNLQIPKTTDEWDFIEGIFKNLNLSIIKRVMENLTEEQIIELKKSPYTKLKQLVVNQTEFDEKEKEEYKKNYDIEWYVDDIKGYMRAYTKGGKKIPERDRIMTPIEEDYYLYGLMSEKEYLYYSGKSDNPPDPDSSNYDKATRTNKMLMIDPIVNGKNYLEINERIKKQVEWRRGLGS